MGGEGEGEGGGGRGFYKMGYFFISIFLSIIENIVIIGAVFSVAAVIIVVLLGLLILMWIKRRKIVIASTVETTECDKTPKTEEEKGRT